MVGDWLTQAGGSYEYPPRAPDEPSEPKLPEPIVCLTLAGPYHPRHSPTPMRHATRGPDGIVPLQRDR